MMGVTYLGAGIPVVIWINFMLFNFFGVQFANNAL